MAKTESKIPIESQITRQTHRYTDRKRQRDDGVRLGGIEGLRKEVRFLEPNRYWCKPNLIESVHHTREVFEC